MFPFNPRSFIFANLDGHYLANNTDSPKLVYSPKFACACIRVMYMMHTVKDKNHRFLVARNITGGSLLARIDEVKDMS